MEIAEDLGPRFPPERAFMHMIRPFPVALFSGFTAPFFLDMNCNGFIRGDGPKQG